MYSREKLAVNKYLQQKHPIFIYHFKFKMFQVNKPVPICKLSILINN